MKARGVSQSAGGIHNCRGLGRGTVWGLGEVEGYIVD